MVWSEEAEKAVSRVPFFVRKRVRKDVEKEAAEQGGGRVLIEHVNACRERFLSGKDVRIKGYQIEMCFGSGGCENRAMASNELVDNLEKLLAGRNFAEFLKKRVQGQVKFHHELRISVSDCPNACSRPQIVDIGIIGARSPRLSDEQCVGCGACTEACREGAIDLAEGAESPILDMGKCVGCGKCIEACSSGTLEEEAKGWRILLGGKLGRHPQLGRELEGIYSTEQVLALVERCLDLYFTHNTTGERLGTILDRIGLSRIGLKTRQDLQD